MCFWYIFYRKALADDGIIYTLIWKYIPPPMVENTSE